MDFRTKSRRAFSLVRNSALAAMIVTTMALSACDSGGGASNAVVMPPVTTAKSCTNIVGSLDPLQTTLTGQLQPAVLALPVVGGPAAGATAALSQTLDAVDAISAALGTLAQTQNPQLFTTQLGGAGDSVLCSGASLADALAQLSTSQTLPIPGLAAVQHTLSTVLARVADGLVSTAPGDDLQLLTDQLVVLASQLEALSASLPVPVNQSYLQQVLALNATAFNSLALILGDLGALDGDQLSYDVTALLLAGANGLPTALAAELGVPTATLAPVNSQFLLAAQTLHAVLTTVATPTLQAVSAVLGGGSVGATASFSDLLDGSLTDTSSIASLTRVTEVSQLLGTGNSLLAALLQTFGGVLPG